MRPGIHLFSPSRLFTMTDGSRLALPAIIRGHPLHTDITKMALWRKKRYSKNQYVMKFEEKYRRARGGGTTTTEGTTSTLTFTSYHITSHHTNNVTSHTPSSHHAISYYNM